MAYKWVCPLAGTAGHGTEAGYSMGGFLSHASRCALANTAAAERGMAVDLKVSTRGVQTEDEFFAAAAAKLAQSAPVQPTAAGEEVTVVLADGTRIIGRKA